MYSVASVASVNSGSMHVRCHEAPSSRKSIHHSLDKKMRPYSATSAGGVCMATMTVRVDNRSSHPQMVGRCLCGI